MADSSSDVLRKEFYLFIHRNALRTQQIGFNVASKGPGEKLVCCLRFGLLVTSAGPSCSSSDSEVCELGSFAWL